MIKRRFYKMEHGDRDAPSNPSSSSSDSEVEPEPTQDSSENDVVEEQLDDNAQSCSTSSGYESEDSSANEVQIDLSGMPISEDDAETGNEGQTLMDNSFPGKSGSEFLQQQSAIMANEESLPVDFPACIVKCKSVFKCRICPRIVCLNEETLRAHLKSKRHARSEKLLDDGRLKTILNSDGKIDEEVDTPAFYARILASSQGLPRKKSKTQDKKVSKKKRQRYDSKKSQGQAAKRGRN